MELNIKCYICNNTLQSVHYNRDHKDFDPCPTCLDVINDVFADEPTDLDDKSEDGITEDEVDKLIASWEELRIDVV